MNDIAVTFRFGEPDFWLPLLAVFLAAAALWQFLSLSRRLSRPTALGLTLLRVAALAAIVCFVLEPSLLRQRKEKYRPALAVMVDDSQSMGMEGEVEGTRLERVKSFLASEAFGEVIDGYYPEFYTFSEGVNRIDEADLEDLEPVGRWTDLGTALSSVREKAPVSLGAVLVFTDGGHNDAPAPPGSVPGAGTIPRLFVGVGEEDQLKDVEVVDVQSAGMAFAGRSARLTVEVRAKGFAGRTFPLLLKEQEKVLLSREVKFTEAEETRRLEIPWEPPRPGRYQLSFSVPPQGEERIRENNKVAFSLEAVRDKIRVLLVSGRPSWNHRFLRDAIKGDPSIDLVSFIILRTATDAVNVPQNELSLIPFPTRKIFLEELSNFDLVIFENFSYRFYFPVQYLERMRDFVREGGGFWMLGGPLSFIGGGYAGTPLEEVLPVTLFPMPAGKGYVPDEAPLSLTPEGENHPFFQGLGDGAEGDVPLFEGYNMAGPAVEGTMILAEHRRSDDKMQPMIALGRYGEGRTLAFLSDSLWKWNFEMVGKGRGNHFYLSFVRQAIRWSVGDPSFQPVVIRLEKNRLVPGEKVRAGIHVLGEDFLPAENPELRVTLRREDGTRQVLPLRRESTGLFAVESEVSGIGSFELEAAVSRGGEVYGRDSAFIEMSWPVNEFRNPGLNGKALRYFAGEGGAAPIVLEEDGATARRLRRLLEETTPVYRVEFEEEKELGGEWWAFTLVFALFGTEWLVRKRRGLD